MLISLLNESVEIKALLLLLSIVLLVVVMESNIDVSDLSFNAALNLKQLTDGP